LVVGAAWATNGVAQRTRAHRPVIRAFRRNLRRRRQDAARAAVSLERPCAATG
jgi:hypothetical protein